MQLRTRPLRLLLVMSHPATERWVERQLAGPTGDPSGGRVMAVVGHAAGTGGALAAADATHPDVALVDMLLPEGNGFALARQLRHRFPDLRVVMTGHEAHVRFDGVARAAGAAGFLSLPALTPEALVALAAPLRAAPAEVPLAA